MSVIAPSRVGTGRLAVEASRQAEFERFERHVAMMARLDEITDAAERLSAPMQTSFEYMLDSGGDLTYNGQSIRSVFEKGVKAAQAMAEADPSLAFELTRRQIELQEYYDACRFAAADSELDVMVVISPIPDAVLAGSRINGYNRKRLKTLARVYERIPGGVKVWSLSLDRTDREGLAAVARLLGEDLPVDEPSEVTLTRRFASTRSGLKNDPVRTVTRVYDQVLEEKYGGNWFAGRPDSENKVKNTIEFILGQPALIDAHMAEISRIQALALDLQMSEPELDMLLDKARYNFAANLTAIMEGRLSHGSVDLGGSGDWARSEGRKFEGDCPTGAAAAQQSMTAEQTVNALFGYESRGGFDSCMNCPLCKKPGVWVRTDSAGVYYTCGESNDRKAGGLIQPRKSSGKCGATTDPDQMRIREAAELREKQARIARTAIAATNPRRTATDKLEAMKQKYGQALQVETRFYVGGADRVVVDSAGEIVETLG